MGGGRGGKGWGGVEREKKKECVCVLAAGTYWEGHPIWDHPKCSGSHELPDWPGPREISWDSRLSGIARNLVRSQTVRELTRSRVISYPPGPPFSLLGP
jgi:hypothetical protein